MGAIYKRKNRMVAIDGEKLHGILQERGINMRGLSEDMGFECSYINHACGRGEINSGGARVLEILTGISLDDYAKKEPEPEPEVVESPLDRIEDEQDAKIELGNDAFWRKLSLTIYHSVYEAVSKAWNEPINVRREGD